MTNDKDYDEQRRLKSFISNNFLPPAIQSSL